MKTTRTAPMMVVFAMAVLALTVSAQQPQPAAEARRPTPIGFWDIGVRTNRLPDEPMVFDTAEQHKIKVTVVAKGFAHPWSLAFLPDQSMLVTERDGRLRLVRHGKLEAQPVSGAPTVFVANLWGLMDVALHPRFAENRLVYLSYLKPSAAGRGGTLC